MSYGWVWLIVIGAGGATLFCAYMPLRATGPGYLRALACGLILVLLLTPAPVPGYPLNYAPAFVVAVFEGVLKSDGTPGVALRLLGVATVTITVLVLGASGVRRWSPWSRPEK
ncbi:MAG: hypothetical protein VB949_00985 [Pseudomonadales bacterium]|jgi:hypothetical protein